MPPGCDLLTQHWASLYDRYLEKVREFLKGPFSDQNVSAKLDRWAAQIDDAVHEQARATHNGPYLTHADWQAELKKVGVNMDIQLLPQAAFLEKLKSKQVPIFMVAWTSFVTDPWYQFMFLLGSKSFCNYAAINDSQLDSWIKTATPMVRKEDRYNLAMEVQKYVSNADLWVYMFQPIADTAMNKKILLVSVVVVVVGLVIGLCFFLKVGSGQIPAVRIGYLNLVTGLPLFVAEEKGFFREEGLECK